MPILQNIRSCVRRKHGITRRPTKVHFNVTIGDAFKSENVASQLRDLLVFIAREGVAVTDLFRRPGNPQSIKKIITDLEAGRPVNWSEYNFYTLANIAKRFLLHIEGGLLGRKAENDFIEALNIVDMDARYSSMHAIIRAQPKIVQQLLALLFGTWFRMIYHTEVNAMSVEAVAKSVAGSIFPSCTYSPDRVELASKVMEVLIVGFASANLFGHELIEYFTNETQTSISRVEKYKYEFRFPKDVPHQRSTQMFAQLLLEESKKHNFDILKDEVSKKVFESASQTPLVSNVLTADESSTPSTLLNNLSTSANLPDEISDKYVPVNRSSSFRTPLATIQPQLQNIYQLNDVASRLQPINHDYAGKLRVDRIQQFSEKRTCITATPDSHFRCDKGAVDLDADIPSQCSNYCSVVPSKQPFAFDSPNSDSDIIPHLDEQEWMCAQGSIQNGCFNSVKRRQLERLQKRSDWFLSPPTGLRNSGMMRLDSTTSPETQRNASKILRSSVNAEGCDEKGEAVRKFCSTLKQGDQLRRKVSHRSQQLAETEVNKINQMISEKMEATNKPKKLSFVSPISKDNGLTSDQLTDDEIVEVRYFISEKYYGPEKQTSLLNNVSSLSYPQSDSPNFAILGSDCGL